MHLFAGSYTLPNPPLNGQPGEGIYTLAFDPDTGAMEGSRVCRDVVNPSYLAIHPNHRFMYSVSEYGGEGGQAKAAVAALSIGHDGRLAFLGQQTLDGSRAPCYVSCDPKGEFVCVASYQKGLAAIFPIAADGSLEPAADVSVHKGSSVNLKRQESPHAHAAYLDSQGETLFVPDLGIDQVVVYRIQRSPLKLVRHDPACADMPPGAGPRHMAFHPDSGYAYVLNELGSSVTVIEYSEGYQSVRVGDTYPTLPEEFEEENASADIHLHPSQRYLYASNRGHDSIAVFAVASDGASLERVQLFPSQGKTPRGMRLSPDGRFLVVANQDGGGIHSLAIDAATGHLSHSGQSVDLPACVCLQFLN